MSSDLYVKSIARGVLKVRRRKHLSGEVIICFNDSSISPIHIIDEKIVNVMENKAVTVYAAQRSNIRSLVAQGFLEVVM